MAACFCSAKLVRFGGDFLRLLCVECRRGDERGGEQESCFHGLEHFLETFDKVGRFLHGEAERGQETDDVGA